jgi:hypothetical protein
MYGEGYDWAQQYSVSSGDFVGALPVGMQSRGTSDLPYWPSQNTYVYKEVWVHSVSRWLWLMADLLPDGATSAGRPTFAVTSASLPNGDVTVRLTTSGGEGAHTFALRADGLVVDRPARAVTLRAGRATTIEWKARPAAADVPWVAVVIPDGEVGRRREVMH